jgi:hypothetical protein
MSSVDSRPHIVRLVFGAMVAEARFTAARVGIADEFGDEERSGSQLASDTVTPLPPPSEFSLLDAEPTS